MLGPRWAEAHIRIGRADPGGVEEESVVSEGNPFQQTRALTPERAQLFMRSAEALAERYEDELARWLSDSSVRAEPVEQTRIPDMDQDETDLCVIKAKFHLTHGVIVIDLHLALGIVSMLCGGIGQAVPEIRPLSRLEMGVFDLVLEPLMDLSNTLFDTGPLELGTHVTNASALPDSAPEAAVAFPLQMKVGNIEGRITIGLTLAQLQEFSEELDRRIAGRQLSKSTAPSRQTVRAVRPVPVELVVGFEPMRVPAGQLAGLQVGDVLKTRQSVSKNLVARIGQERVFTVRAGQRGQRLVAEVVARIDKDKGVE